MRVAARLISTVFHPLLLATWVVVLFGNLNRYALGTEPVGKLAVVIFFNTFFFPAMSVFLMYMLDFIPDMKLRNKQDRTIPFIATMIFYIWSFMVVQQMQMPLFLQLFILGATVSVILAFVINIFYKISLHMVGMGGVLMLLILVIFAGGLDLAHPLLALLLLTGLVGSARMAEGAHTLGELYYGLIVGLMGQMIGLLIFNNMGLG